MERKRLEETVTSLGCSLSILTATLIHCPLWILSTLSSSPLAHKLLDGRYYLVLTFVSSVSSTGPGIK